MRNSCDEVLNKDELQTALKGSGLVALGLVVDADTDFAARWQRIKTVCEQLGGSPPDDCPKNGLILPIGKKRFGAWIMPDNNIPGMIENFCHTLVPESAKPLWEFARTCVDQAKSKGATFIDNHLDKAHIHTWLAWQNPPGERMGMAITKRILNHDTESAKAFVAWFRNLFEV